MAMKASAPVISAPFQYTSKRYSYMNIPVTTSSHTDSTKNAIASPHQLTFAIRDIAPTVVLNECHRPEKQLHVKVATEVVELLNPHVGVVFDSIDIVAITGDPSCDGRERARDRNATVQGLRRPRRVGTS